MSKTNYGNWVPADMIKAMVAADALIAVPMIGMTIYMSICRRKFDFEHGGLMGRIHQDVADHLDWDGKGKLLDVGCGAGALGIRCLKKYPEAELTGMDYWGKGWNYAKEQCENNAAAEGVGTRATFVKGDAASLPFPDASFDAVVSNFVYHEVKTQPDKHALIRETLRVLKPGGSFALQDLMSQKPLYGDMDAFCQELLDEGLVSEIHFLPHTEKSDYVPNYIKAPWMLSGMGMIYGKK